MEKITLKIIKKSKEGITLKGGNGMKPRTFTWDEFNSAYIIDKEDKFLAVMKPELVADFQDERKNIKRFDIIK